MTKPPITVQHYFFPYVEIAADPEYNPENTNDTADSFETKVSIDNSPENNLYQVMLDISLFPENEEKKNPYSIHLVAVGLFTVEDNYQDKENLLKITGASILYSAAREYIITLTSRGPWPPLFLPTISFLPPQKQDDAGSSLAPKKQGVKKNVPKK